MTIPTTNFAWPKPVNNADSDTWGTELNTIFDDIDAQIAAFLSVTGNRFTIGGSNVSVAAWTTNAVRAKFAGATYTDSSSSGTVAAVYVDAHKAATLAASSATVYTNAYGCYFEDPVAGTNVTLSSKYALGADSLKVTGHVTLEGVTSTGATGTGKLVFDTAGTVANLTVNQVSSTSIALTVSADASGESAAIQAAAGASGGASIPVLNLLQKATSSNNVWAQFNSDNTDTLRGSISYNRGGGLVAYNTTSDYRLKDISGPYINSGSAIDAVPVHWGQMKGAIIQRPMFLAHEVQMVAPWAVTGDKDAVTEGGAILPQMLDSGALIETMWAEIQSIRARLKAARIA